MTAVVLVAKWFLLLLAAGGCYITILPGPGGLTVVTDAQKEQKLSQLKTITVR